MITRLQSNPTVPQRAVPTPCPDQPEADPVFDLSLLDNARENYFLPGVDRLAASLAACYGGPVKVRLEAEGQFMEYTMDPTRPESPVVGSLNGNPFELQPQDAGGGAWRLAGDTPGGAIKIKVAQRPDGSHANGLINGMPINQGIHFDENGEHVADLDGNFACARLAQTVTREDEGYHLTGTLGRHNLDYRVTEQENEGFLVQGQFGDMTFRQTITPVQS